MDHHSYITGGDSAAIDAMYLQYLENPESVDATWRNFFMGFDFARKNYENKPAGSVQVSNISTKEFDVINLINGYRNRGHLFTATNPVRTRRKYYPTLDISNFNLKPEDLETVFQAGQNIGLGAAKLKDIVAFLEETYCKSVGVEYVYIRKPEVVEWLQKKMESTKNQNIFSAEEKKRMYQNLEVAVGFEKFIHKKFIGQKRFSLEGAETLIPALSEAIEHGAELGIEEFMIGMPHRGRLNVLANILKKPSENIFNEFTGKAYNDEIALGDVKYHLGYCNDFVTSKNKKVRLNLLPNPSHLETVGPVTAGLARAKIYHKYANNSDKLVPIILHGDAAVATQGVVYELVQMSQLQGYKTGGTIHLVVNNQVGFTTNYLDARSSTYCTDVAKVVRAPVFHVNGDDVEAIVYTMRLAMEFRQRFQSDVFIDLLGYRKFGHNEGDEPRFTQPLLYKIIAKHPNPRDIYGKQLLEQNVMSQEEIQQSETNYNDYLETRLEVAKTLGRVTIQRFLLDDWATYRHSTDKDFLKSIPTGVAKETLLQIAEKINRFPSELQVFNKIEKLLADRKAFIADNKVDWALGELLAYGTLVNEGHSVRLSGQDVERGTFSHRHAGYTLEDSNERYFPLKHIAENQASFHAYNSPLSEYGVLGFEYGYALAVPNGLTIWEAQFGDFNNVAQPIIDQYISSAEEKWGLLNGLVMLLPHGFEGMGPEHSSARMERFLQISANNNMQIVVPTTPANLFHMLRRQVKTEYRVPLVVFTPKSLLRHSKVVSSLNELTTGSFQEVIDDPNVDVESVSRVVLCTGKIYYDLLERKEQLNARDLALVRVEQLHPFPQRQLSQLIRKYKNAQLTLWVQEEPENMGAWHYVKNSFKNVELLNISRLPSGSPAVGLHELHELGQREIVNKVFRKCDCDLKRNYCGLQCVKGRSREEIMKQFNYFE